MVTRVFVRRVVFCVVVALVALSPLLVARAFSAHRAPRDTYRAYVTCAGGMAEDTAAHVRMVAYTAHDDGSVRIVYACRRAGY